MDSTTCKTCNRVVWTTDVNEAGICVVCLEEKPAGAVADVELSPASSSDAVSSSFANLKKTQTERGRR